MTMGYNEDCVSVFEKGWDEDDVTSTTKTILSIACNTVCDKLLVNNVIENIEKIPVNINFLEPDILDAIIPID